MVLDEFVDLSVDSNRWKMYGNMISMAQFWISDIHQRSVYCAYNLQDEEEISIIVVWGDVMVGIANTKETNDKFVEKLAAKYKIKVIGEQYMLLIIHITPNNKNHTIQLSQSHYIHQILMSSVWKMQILYQCLCI